MKKNDQRNIVKKEFSKSKKQSKKTFENSWYFDIAGLGIIILLGIIIYSNSFDCSFHLDDKTSIMENSSIRDISNLKAIYNDNDHSRFIPYLTFAINYHFGKLNLWGYHLVNLIIHLINSCLVWWLTLLIFSSPNMKNNSNSKHKKILAIITALFFVSHPLATQSVTYIVQRMASLVALFYFLSIAFYLKARLTDKVNSSKYSLFGGSLISGILAFLCKENAYTLPFAILLVELCFMQANKISINFKDKRILFASLGLICFFLFVLFSFSFNIFKPHIPDFTNDFRTITSLNYLLTQFTVIVKYIQLLFIPINQNLDYYIPLSTSFFEIKTVLGFLILLSLFALGIFLFKRNRIISFGIFWLFLALSVESSIIPIDDLIFEHRTYLPSFGFFLLISCEFYSFFWDKFKTIVIVVFSFIVASNSYMTYERNKIWKDDITLWSDVILKSPKKVRAFINRGNEFRKYFKYDNALFDYNTAIELKPDFSKAYFDRGTIFEAEKKNKQALKDYNKAIELNINYTEGYVNRGNILRNENRIVEALEDYNKAILLNPNFLEAYNNRGTLLMDEKKYDEAIINFNKAIQLKPDNSPAYFNRGIIFTDQKKHENAINDFSRVIVLNKDDSEAYYYRGSAEYNSGKKENACADWKKALSLGYQPAADLLKKYCN